MAVYDGLRMFQQHLQHGGELQHHQDSSSTGAGGSSQSHDDDPTLETLNPKLKQFYEVDTKIEPFFTGGQVCILDSTRFLCQCGPGVRLISTKVEKDKDKMNGSVEINPKKKGTTNWDDHGFKVLSSFEIDMDEILTFDVCSITQTLVTAHKSQLIRLWNIPTKEISRTIKSFHTTPIKIISVYRAHGSEDTNSTNPNGITLNGKTEEEEVVENDTVSTRTSALTWATISGNVVKVWDAGGNNVSKVIRIDGVPLIGFVKWKDESGSKKKQLFVAERNIYIIEVSDETKQYQVSKVLQGHYSQVTGIEWATEKNIMISAGKDKAMILWDTSEEEYSKLTTLAFPEAILALNLQSEKDLLVFGDPGSIKHFDMENHKLSSKPLLSWGADEEIVAVHPPGSSGSKDFLISTHTSVIYQIGQKITSKKKRTYALKIKGQFVGSLEEILQVRLWENNKVAVATNSSMIKVYDLRTENCRFLRGHTNIVLTLSSKDSWLVSGSKDHTIIFWESHSLEPQAILHGHLNSVTSVCFNPVKEIVYSVSEDNFLKAWSKETCLNSAVAHEKDIHVVDSSPNGQLVVTGSRDKTAKIWNAEGLKLVGTLKGHKKSVWDARFSLWDQLIVTSSADTTLKIWNLVSYECIKTLQGHTSSVLQGTFVNNGLQILSSSNDGTWKTWEVKSSTCLATLESSEDKIWALEASPDGSSVVTGTADSVLTIWKDVTERKVEELQRKRKEALENEQRLNNVLRSGDWTQAVHLAIDLDRPYTLLKIIREVPNTTELQPVIMDLGLDQKQTLMGYIKQWNTNTKTSTEAQIMLNILLTSTSPAELTYLDTVVLLPYTQKHFSRLQKIQQHVVLAEYISKMSGS